MTKDDALELIERMPYIPAFVISNERNRLSALRAAQKSDDPVEWIKVVKTIYICRNAPKTGRRPSDAEAAMEQQAKLQLQNLLVPALGLDPEQLDSFIESHLANMW